MRFQDKVVIVTGAGRGIGRSIAVTYASEGARVVIAEKEPVTGRETERLITSAGGTACFIQTDVSNPEDITVMTRKTTELFGTIDILVNNAGFGRWKPPCDLTTEEWDEVINTNLRGAFLCAREAARVMKEHGGGSIINIASTRALMSEPDSEAYAASKGGISCPDPRSCGIIQQGSYQGKLHQSGLDRDRRLQQAPGGRPQSAFLGPCREAGGHCGSMPLPEQQRERFHQRREYRN